DGGPPGGGRGGHAGRRGPEVHTAGGGGRPRQVGADRRLLNVTASGGSRSPAGGAAGALVPRARELSPGPASAYSRSDHPDLSRLVRARRTMMGRIRSLAVAAALGLTLGLLHGPASGQTPKSGGILNVTQREELPQGFAVHETSTISSVWPVMPCFNNLVLFDPLKKTEGPDTIIGELAEKWVWQDNFRNLVFFLRKDVKWHDGQPFTSKDVKFTFDMLREAPDAQGKLRINPRKDWYANVEAVEAADPHTVVFRLKRPQPSLLMMLASGYTP